MEKEEFNRQLMSLTVIYIGILASLVMFSGVSLFILKSNTDTISTLDAQTIMMFKVFIFPAALASIAGSNYLFNKQVSSIKVEEPMEKKMSKFRTFYIIRLALIDSASVLSIVGFFMTSDYQFMLINAILIVYYLLQLPTREKIKKSLPLTTDQEMLLSGE